MEAKYCGRYKMLGELKSMYNSVFTADYETKFLLVQKYLRYVESNSESISNVFYGKDPLTILKEDKMFFKELENWCLQTLGAANGPNNMTLFKDAPQVQARAYLGLVYEIGACGLKKSIERAISLYASAAKQNNAFATFRLAQCFESGKGKQLNIEKSITFYRCAAKLGGIEAMHIYGSILIHGELGLRKDISQGLFYLKLAAQAASKHYPFPFYDLARCYENEEDAPEITVDHEYAFQLFEKGAKLGDPNCQYKLAKAYEVGDLSCEINLNMAIQWYTQAAEYEQIDALFELAHFKLIGLEGIIEKNYDDAYYLALRAAAKGHVDAAFLVGECIENGLGIRQDPLHAMWWYTIAKALGNDKATTKINELRKIVGGSHNNLSPQGCRMF
ncbi:hypothetical protein BDAP_002365 [Binucleata daphniae]